MPDAVACHWIACVAALVTALAAAGGGWLARGSTALPAAAWSVLAALALAAEMAGRGAGLLAGPAAVGNARLTVMALAVCPTMALLGAKRPQHGAWQFIVATLAGVLALPAASAALVRPGSPPGIHPLQQAFMGLLVAVGWMNFAATRHGLAALLVAVGQGILLWPCLPAVLATEWADRPAWDAAAALAVATGAVVAGGVSSRWPAGRRGRRGLAVLVDPAFLGLRETLGAAWTLRIAERFNELATARGWPCRLGFGGLAEEPAAGTEWHAAALASCRAILLRFVNDDWLGRHGWPTAVGSTDPAARPSA